MKNKSRSLIALPTILFLTACGGGSSSNNQQPNGTSTPAVTAQPRVLETENWQSARLIQTENPLHNSVEVVGSELIINVASNDIAQGAHLQIYINSDNKPETGFQFSNQAWEESGVDFLIEDGDLFKSTANNTGWNWNVNFGAIDYTIGTNNATAKIDLSLLGNICNNLKIGVMTRDEFWDIETFSPASSQMQTFNVAYCSTTVGDVVKPEISLLGANPLNLTVGDTFTDPGAIATDNIDGDITARIAPKSTVNTDIAGTYEVNYLVTDLAGNSANVSRLVIVNNTTQADGIVIDGNSNDWADIATLSSSADAIMKVSDDQEKLYILVTSSNLGENTQILMDTDNNASTGLELTAQINTWLAGADYMIENNLLDKSKSNTGWSWDYGVAPIEFIKTADTLEIAINKSDLNSLANQIPIGYVSRTADWNTNYTLPEQSLPIYTLKFPAVANSVIAVNDSTTTLNTDAINFNVLNNDSSSSNSSLTVSLLTQPQSGNARVLANNRIRYTPDLSFTGIVNFDYEITDTNGNTDSATVSIIVTAPTAVNTDPDAVNDSASTDEGISIDISVLANDSDADGDNLVISNISNVSNGTAVTNGNAITYTPANNFTGTDVFTYTVSDGNGGTDTANVTVTINEVIPANSAPNAINDIATTDQNVLVTIQVLGNDNDADGDNLVISNISNVSDGTAVVNGNAINFTPVNDFIGTEVFTYTVSDGNGGTDTANVTVTINEVIPANTAPNAINDSATTDQGVRINISALANDNDANGDTLNIASVSNFSNGGSATVTNDNIIRYTPAANFSGTETFRYTITDGNGGSDAATISVLVNPTVVPNRAPDAVEDVASVSFNQTVTVDVLANDTDPDGDTLSIIPESVAAITQGQATLNADGTITFDPQNTVASLSVFYTVTDGRGGTDSAVLTIASTDPADNNISFPTVNNEFVTTPINTPIFIDVLANDFDSDGDTLSIDMVDNPTDGTTEKVTRNGVEGILYTPDPGFTGVNVFFYGVPDGRGNNGSGFVRVTVE